MVKNLNELRAEQIAKSEPWDTLKVNSLWVHLLRGMIKDKVIAKIGLSAFAVYVAIKAHVDLETGNAWPSVELLAEQVGVTERTVFNSIKKLVEEGLLKVEKKGRSNHYSIVETINIVEQTGEPWGNGQRKYVPTGFGDFVEELKRLAKTGNLPVDKAITINLVVNIQQNAHGATGNINNMGDINVKVGSDDDLHSLLKDLGRASS